MKPKKLYTADELQAIKRKLEVHEAYLRTVIGGQVQLKMTFNLAIEIRDLAQKLCYTMLALQKADVVIKAAGLVGPAALFFDPQEVDMPV